MSDEQIRCPKCHSSQIHVDKRGFKTGRAIAGGMVTGNILVAAAAGGIGMNDIELTCLKCGHKFKPGEAYSTSSIEQDQNMVAFEKLVVNEREQTAMYRCDCGKESCLPVNRPICPKCGRKLNDTNKFVPESPKNGCLGMILIPVIIIAMLCV